MKLHLHLLAVTIALLASGSIAFAESKPNVDKAGVALQGYDPVSYFAGEKPQKGNSSFQEKADGAIFLFANDANRKEFLKNPKKYEPQFGGWCAFAVADSKSKVEVDPKSFVIQDGKLLLFYNGIWADTQKKWLKEPNTLLKTALANWPEVENKEP